MKNRLWSPLFILFLIPFSMASTCKENTTLSGFSSDLAMVQHQLRGVVNIIDGCSFSVSQFDMLSGSDRVRWWGASNDSFNNLTSGFRISDMSLNQTYGNDSFTVYLLPNISWEQMHVLAVWDEPTASDFGHLFLESNSNLLAPSPDLSPAPSPISDHDNVSPSSRRPSYSQPTMFVNCRTLSPNYRLRWTLLSESNSIAIGLEAAVGSQYYMAFGWADPAATSPTMILADVVVAGFSEEGVPFAEDYFITDYSECLLNKDGKVEGVCPDTIYEGSDPVGFVNNTKLIYGHRRDGVSFVRYERPIVSKDEKYDVHVNEASNMTVIWALGLIRPPDTIRPYYLPQNHGGPKLTTFGFLTLNLSDNSNDCIEPLDAEDKEDQDLIIADGKAPLIVTSGPAVHYPNPPNPAKVIYINKKEAPHLRVERGVPVTFSIQAGHDLALYITSNPIGGNATSRNVSEIIYAGGADSEGVPASPKDLIWAPDRNTPDEVYYHSFFEQKMGWKVQVVDGGLSDMYNNSVLLDDQQATLFWTLSDNSITIAARGEKKSSYLAIGLGSGMVNSYAYIGWIDDDGKGHVGTYWIDGKDAHSIHPTSENITYVRCRSENGIITFEFTRPLNPSCSGRIECDNIIDPTTPLRVVWAMGSRWSADQLSEKNMHSVTSSKPVRVSLLRGSAEAEQDLRPVLAAHGFMMFIAWGLLLPGGILAARYLKHVKGGGWYQIHVYLQYSGIAIVLLGAVFAAAELRGFYISSLHVKFGLAAIVLACVQPVNAYLRPNKPANGEVSSLRRVIWEYFHAIIGRSALIVGIAALFTGMKHLGNRYDSENVEGLTWALIIWFLLVALLVFSLEYAELKRRRRDRNSLRGNWVLGNEEEDDSLDLLHHKTTSIGTDFASSNRMEVQLEPIR